MGALVNDNSQAKGPINHKRVLPALLAFATMCASIVCGLVTLVIFVVNGTVYIELDGADNFEVVLAAIGTIYLVTLLFVPIYFFELFNQTKYDQKKHYYLASIFLVYAAIGIYFFIGVFNLVDNAWNLIVVVLGLAAGIVSIVFDAKKPPQPKPVVSAQSNSSSSFPSFPAASAPSQSSAPESFHEHHSSSDNSFSSGSSSNSSDNGSSSSNS